MEILPSPKKGHLLVIVGPHAAPEQTAMLAAGLALRAPVTVLDGGNRFAPYQVMRLLRQQTVDVSACADRLFIRRAFTCYQMLALLENTSARYQPYLVLDFLATFFDEQIRVDEARGLLRRCLDQIEHLRHSVPVVLTLAPPPLPERAFLFEQVCDRADYLFNTDVLQPQSVQLGLL